MNTLSPAQIAEIAEFFEKFPTVYDSDREVHRCSTALLSHAAAQAARIEELEKALRNLLKRNEDWNAAVSKICEPPAYWSDGYLNEARAALKGTP